MYQFNAAPTQLPFLTTWKTDNPGASGDNQIAIPTNPSFTYNYMVDWGDGNSDTGVTGDIAHTYAAPGTYTVSITGDFPAIYFELSGDKEKILSVDQWGDIQWQSMEFAFSQCINLDVVAPDVPDLSAVSTMTSMFIGCTSLQGTAAFNNWDVSGVSDLSFMFSVANSFNQNIGNWVLSGATNLNMMFAENTAFNGAIGNWDVSGVTDMGSMFLGATSFNQDIGGWDVSNVNNMEGMFNNATAFNQDIGNWDVSLVSSMNGMFWNATAFDQNLGNWDISSVQGMAVMFSGANLSTENYDATLTSWSTLDTNAGETLIPTGIELDAGNSFYCDSESARQQLIETYGWTITDGGKDPNCVGDTEPPVITCPPTIVEFVPDGESSIPITLENPTATDNVSELGNITFTGVRSDGGPITGAAFELFPIENVTITWTATDEAGNTSEPCEQLVSIAYEASSGTLDPSGELSLTDGTTDTDDAFTLSVSGGNLVVGSTAGIQITGEGVVQVDANTVEIPLSGITSGLTLDGGGSTYPQPGHLPCAVGRK